MTDAERIAELERRLGVRFANPACALEALTHKSYANEVVAGGPGGPAPDNERLEFLGDAVIDLAISHRLMERCPAAKEGELSKARAAVVNEAGLAEVARRLGLGDLLLLGKGEEQTGGRDKPSVLANALEAVIAALYQDGQMEAVLGFVDRSFCAAFERAADGSLDQDYKTRLQELGQALFKASPRYKVISETGPDHEKVYTVALLLGDAERGRGTGRSKKDAEQRAAQQALEALSGYGT